MAVRSATITFYNLVECGYYMRGRGEPEFGECSQILHSLREWSLGKPVSLTKLWDADNDENDDQLPVYLFDMARTDVDWLVATWNEVSSTGNAVLSLAEDSIVGGQSETHANEVVERTIPGFPAYFWFLPERGLVATVKFDGTLAAKNPMIKYFLHFLRNESCYVVQDEDGAIIGYADHRAAGDELARVYPKFKLGSYAKPGEIDLIKRSRERIRKVVRSSALVANNGVDARFFAGALSFFRGVDVQRNIAHEQKVRVELELEPTAEELDHMIETELGIDRNQAWGGLGFVLRGEGGRVRWVSHSLARDSFEFDVRTDRSGVVVVESLMERLQRSKENILSLLE